MNGGSQVFVSLYYKTFLCLPRLATAYQQGRPSALGRSGEVLARAIGADQTGVDRLWRYQEHNETGLAVFDYESVGPCNPLCHGTPTVVSDIALAALSTGPGAICPDWVTPARWTPDSG